MLVGEKNIPDTEDLDECGLCKATRNSDGKTLNAILQVGEERKECQEEGREGKQELSRHGERRQEIEVLTRCGTDV